MSWMSKLCETYENIHKLGLYDNGEVMLAPICHTLQNAHINIVIDGDGNFRRAEVLDKRTKIALPVTESSAGRTNNQAPHPLADKLQYLAKDYAKYGGTGKPYFQSYYQQLSDWCFSQFSHPKLHAVLRYIEKGSVVEDLVQEKIIYLDENNRMLTQWTKEVAEAGPMPKLFTVLPKVKGGVDQGSALVCWTVKIAGEPSSNTWDDESLQKSWREFDTAQEAKRGLCVITGNISRLVTNNPAKIRHGGDKAKLISSNDKEGFTYRGRFTDDSQACGISYEVTQKAHSALRWLIERQSFRNADQVLVAWAVSGKEVPPLIASSDEHLTDDDFGEIEAIENKKQAEDLSEGIVDHGHNLGKIFAEKFGKKLAGYRAKLDNCEQIVVMGLDSATPGRISITYYRETNAAEFFERLETWYKSFAWLQKRYDVKNSEAKKKEEKPKWFWAESTPSPISIAKAAYGENLQDNLKKKTIERLLFCIVEGAPFPKDLLDSCVRAASNRNAYKNDKKWLWYKNVGIACALYRGYYSRIPNINARRSYQMSLERERNTRDYLYGRLLAVAEQIEGRALKNAGENRITNAERLMQKFSIRPFSTWKIIDEELRVYRNRLRASKNFGLIVYFDKEIEQICNLFDGEDFVSDASLTGEYLLGYYCQKSYRKTKITSGNDINPEVNNEINQEEV